jgi:ADP-ribosylglycohydrolase
VGEALWGMCAADAMSMPAHWYYNIDDIKRDFGGWITGFNAPNNRHPSSILNLSNSVMLTSPFTEFENELFIGDEF